MTNPSAAPAVRFALENKRGIYEVDKGLQIEVLEERAFKTHKHFRGSMPESNGIEEGFEGGAVYAVYGDDHQVDLWSGLTLVNGQIVRQTAVVRKLIDRYNAPSADELRAARQLDRARIVLPLASSRMNNYCRWWLDSVAKLYVCTHSQVLRSNLSDSTLQVIVPPLQTGHQRETIQLLNWTPPVTLDVTDRLIKGRSINSSGLAFGGGQSIGAIVKPFSRHLDVLFPAGEGAARDRSGELLFVSRNESPRRRIVNEDELLPGLRDLGFKILRPGAVPLRDQIDAFRQARVVLAPHGAGLTNILFCRPGTTLIEIFPEGGVHGSAFSRIASHLDFDYFFIVGEKIESKAGRKNPNNSDIRLDKQSFLSFVRQALGAVKA